MIVIIDASSNYNVSMTMPAARSWSHRLLLILITLKTVSKPPAVVHIPSPKDIEL